MFQKLDFSHHWQN